MTKSILLALCLLPVAIAADAQSYKRNNAERYNLQLPGAWMRPKIYKTINYILPEVFTELKDREFCVDCSGARYTIRLHIEPVNIISGDCFDMNRNERDYKEYRCETTYSFRSCLSVYDSSDKRLYDLLLSDPRSELTIQNQQKVRSTYEYFDQRDSRGDFVRTIEQRHDGPAPRSGPVPSEVELMRISEQKLVEIENVLRSRASTSGR